MQTTTTLYYREGSSDKVYQTSIRPQGEHYVVHFAYGRRGSTLNTGSKTPSPVSYLIAKDIYDKLIKEKMAKGYRRGADTANTLPPDSPKTHSGIQCQLLNPITDIQLEQFLFHPDYWMQEKIDGRRLILKKEGAQITGINRLGFPTAVPEAIAQSASQYRHDFILDGEAIGDHYHVFDLLTIGREDMRPLGFSVRHLRLRDTLRSFHHPYIHEVESLLGPGLMPIFTRLKTEGKEGVVFKNKHAPYIPGRPNSGGPQLKYKFCETASFIVTKVNDKRSVMLILFEGEKVRSAGNVTIPLNHDMPKPGDVVECRYLYAFKESGSIYQPVFLGVREDMQHTECTTSQLKYKTT